MNGMEVAISGKPGKWGSESIGINDETLKIRLYNQCQRDSRVESRLVVYFGISNGESYSYYHYQKPQKVAQKRSQEDIDNNRKHGRTGSYFCLTLRFNGKFCADFRFIYKLLEKTFVKHIENNILSCKDTDGFWEYQIIELSEAVSLLAIIEDELKSEILNNQSKFGQLSFTNDKQHSEGIALLNLERLDQNECLRLLKSGEELYISPEYLKESEVETDNRVENSEIIQNGNSIIPTVEEQVVQHKIVIHEISNNDSEIKTESESAESFNIARYKKWNGSVKYLIAVVVLLTIFIVPFCKPDHKKNIETEDISAVDIQEKDLITNEITREDSMPECKHSIKEPRIINNINIEDNKTGYFVKGKCYVITVNAIVNKVPFPAIGSGKFEVNESNIWLHQDSARCAVYVPIFFDGDTIIISYCYMTEKNDTSFTRSIAVKSK